MLDDRKDHTRNDYLAIAHPWASVGGVVIPTKGPTSKDPKVEHYWPYTGDGSPVEPKDRVGWVPRNPRRPLDYELEEWVATAERLGSAGALLLDTVGLVVVDIDDPAETAWVETWAPPTPLEIRSPREGGGRHRYYRRAAGREAEYRQVIRLAEHDVDLKGWRNYVVAPGSGHRSGGTYTAVVDGVEVGLAGLEAAIRGGLLDRLPVLPLHAIPRRSRTASTGSGYVEMGLTARGAPGDRLAVPSSDAGWSVLRALRRAGRHDGCPWCGSSSSRVTSISVTERGTLVAKCWSDKVTRFEVPDGAAEPEIAALDDLLAPILAQIEDEAWTAEMIAEILDEEPPEARERREREEQDRREASLAELKQRHARKKAKAEAVHPDLARAARAALRVAKRFGGVANAHYEAGGIRPDPTVRCGRPLATQHALTGVGGTYRRGCGSFQCPRCGPPALARKIGAVLEMPVLGEDGRVAGAPLGERPVWAYRAKNRGKEALVRAWRRSRVRLPLMISKECIEEVGHAPEEGAAYVLFHQKDEVVLVSTHQIPRREAEAWASREEREAGVSKLVLEAYRVLGADEERGLPARVEGRVSSSEGLTLDPAKVAQVAAGSAWLAVGRAEAARLKAALEKRAVRISETRDGNGIESVKTVGFVDPLVFAEAVGEAAGDPAPNVRHHIEDEIELDDLLADTA